MTISDLSGIPRPTVLRKLKSLMKSKHIMKDKKNLYSLSTNEDVIKELEDMRIATMKKFSTLLNKYYNIAIQIRT
jgi:predicted transcriptional regulator